MGHVLPFLSKGAEAHIVEWLAVSQSQAVRHVKGGIPLLGQSQKSLATLCCLLDHVLISPMETWKRWASKSQTSFSKPKDWLKKSFYSSWVYTVRLKPKSWKRSLWLLLEMAFKALQLAESTVLLSGWSRYCRCSDLILQLSPCCSCMPVGLVWCAFSGQVCGFCSQVTNVPVLLVGWLQGGASISGLPCRIGWSHSRSIHLRSHSDWFPALPSPASLTPHQRPWGILPGWITCTGILVPSSSSRDADLK